MSSQLRDIADAVSDALGSVTYTSGSVQPTVVRVNWPEYDVERLRGPAIVVVPAGMTITRVDRIHHEYVYTVTVWVARHTPTDERADDMFDLTEEVVDLLRSHDWDDEEVEFPAGVTSPTTVEAEINPDESLHERNTWKAVVTANYTVFRTVL